MLLNSTQSPTKFWRYDYDSGPAQWTWTPPGANTLDILVEGGTPFAKLWRYDTDSDVRQWNWQPPPVFIPDIPAATPFSKLWRYDYDSGSSSYWQGAPDPSTPLPLLGIEPFSKLWRYDYDSNTLWQGAPDPATPLPLLGIEPFSKLWRYDYVDPPWWVWSAPGSDTLAMLVEGGKPFKRLWRYDYDADTRQWNWQAPAVYVGQLIPKTPTVPPQWLYSYLPETIRQGSFPVPMVILGPSPPPVNQAIEWLIRARRRHTR